MTPEQETALAEARIRTAARHGVQIRISAKHAAALVELLRRLRNEANAPYQCYWRDRAQRAEAKLRGGKP